MLANRQKIRSVDIGNRFWLDVDTPESIAHAESKLMSNLDKPHDDGYVAHRLNRPLSRWLSRRLVRTPITPNAITIVGFLIALLGACLFSLGQYGWTLLAGVLVQLASVVDGCDGEVARLKFRSSPFGGWLDTVLDRYADAAMIVGITYGYWLDHPGATAWIVGIVALTGFILASYSKKEFTLRFSAKPPGGAVDKLIKRDLRIFAIFLAALVNRPFEGAILVGALSHLGVLWLFLKILRRRKPR